MGEAIKGSLLQYLRGLKDSSYGIINLYHLDKKILEQNKLKRQRQQDEINARRQRSTLRARRLMHQGSTSTTEQVSKKNEHRLLERVALSATMSSFIWISIWGFNTYLLPLLRHHAQNILPQNAVVEQENSKTRRIWENTEIILQFIFSSLWVLPLYIISKIVNGFWFVDVANSVYQLYHGRPRAFPTVGKMIADFIYGFLIETVFLIQATIVNKIPVMQEFCYVLYCIHLCLLYALYAFEYKWSNMGLDIRLRIQMVETHWPYFCGFSTPLFVITSVTYSYYPTVISACAFSILFPFFIISATNAGTPHETPAARLRLFELSMSICNVFFKKSVKSRTNADTQQSNDFYVNQPQS